MVAWVTISLALHLRTQILANRNFLPSLTGPETLSSHPDWPDASIPGSQWWAPDRGQEMSETIDTIPPIGHRQTRQIRLRGEIHVAVLLMGTMWAPACGPGLEEGPGVLPTQVVAQ